MVTTAFFHIVPILHYNHHHHHHHHHHHLCRLSIIRPLGLFRFRTYFLKLMNLFRQLVGFLGWRLAWRKTSTYTGEHKNRKTRTHIHASSGILTHNPSVWPAEKCTCLRPRGHWDRPFKFSRLNNSPIRRYTSVKLMYLLTHGQINLETICWYKFHDKYIQRALNMLQSHSTLVIFVQSMSSRSFRSS